MREAARGSRCACARLPWLLERRVLTCRCSTMCVDALPRARGAGASANLRNRTGATPLLMAALAGHVGVAEYLLANTDAHPNVVEDALGLSPLMVAAARGDVATVRLLVIGAPRRSLRRALMVDTVTKLGGTAVSLACAAMRRFATEHEWEFGVVRTSAVAELDTKDEARSAQPTQLDVGADTEATEEGEQARHKNNLQRLRDAADVVTMLLETLPDSRRRLLALRQQDSDGYVGSYVLSRRLPPPPPRPARRVAALGDRGR